VSSVVYRFSPEYSLSHCLAGVLVRREVRVPHGNERSAALSTIAHLAGTDDSMDKKIKKKTHVLQQRIQALQQQLAGARKQMDDPHELKLLEQQLAAAEAELAKIKDA
jgi:hypothetical protein